MRELFPASRAITPAEAYGSLGLTSKAFPGRPYTVANMVMTADGRATLGGRTAAISSPADRELFHLLREQVDAVMAGTGTIALEAYGPLVRDPERRARRAAGGLEPQPLAVTATRTMELPVQTPLFGDPGSRIVVLTNSERDAPAAAASVIVERVGEPDLLDLASGMRLLRERHGVRALLLEGGPTVLTAMVGAGLVDELFLALAPVLAGGGEPSLLEGPALAAPVELEPLSVLADEGYLFLRYSLRTGAGR